MKLVTKFAGLALFCWNAHAGDVAMTVQCAEGDTTTGKALTMELSPLKNEATLVYQTGNSTTPITINIAPPGGFYSSADVWVKSSTTGHGQPTIRIEAQKSRTFRTTQFAKVGLTLTQGNDGLFKATTLYYSKGTLDMPETITEETVQFENMNCKITGM